MSKPYSELRNKMTAGQRKRVKAKVETLNEEPEQAAQIVPPWIIEKLKNATEENSMQIIAELIGGAE